MKASNDPAHLVSCLSLGFIVWIPAVLARTCDPDFTDIPSRTYKADYVIDARVHRVPEVRRGTKEVLVRFRINEVLKGRIEKEPDSDRYPTISVGMFSLRGDPGKCVAPLPQLGSRYILFLGARDSPGSGAEGGNMTSSDGGDQSSGFLVSSLPVEFSEGALNDARSSSHSTFGKKPKLKMKPKDSVTFQPGTTLRLQCVVSGRPKPKVVWFINETQLQKTKHVTFQETKRGSTLVIRRLTLSDSGLYRCQAINVAGKTSLKSLNGITVKVTDSISHGIKCERQDYCLNGGTCIMMTALENMIVCRCPQGQTGVRCEEKETGIPNVVMGKGSKKKKF